MRTQSWLATQTERGSARRHQGSVINTFPAGIKYGHWDGNATYALRTGEATC